MIPISEHAPRLLGLGTASPTHRLSQSRAMALAASLSGWPEAEASKLRALYRRTGIETRGSVLLGPDAAGEVSQTFFHAPEPGAPGGPGSRERFGRFEADAPELGERAALKAMHAAGAGAADITHLVAVSCTGVSAPSLDATLVTRLGLRPGVERTFVAFMGCAGAISGLGVARAIARSEPDAVVLVVCVELCSLHLQYDASFEQTIAGALFADGAAAMVVGSRPAQAGPALASRLCTLIPGTADLMTWRIGDHGLRMTLSARIPDVIGDGLRSILSEWLGAHGLGLADIGSWAVHPGGPRVLDATAAALGLAEGALAASRDVLREHGNMSSATLPFVHERLADAGKKQGTVKVPCVWLGFSPGLTVEALLLT